MFPIGYSAHQGRVAARDTTRVKSPATPPNFVARAKPSPERRNHSPRQAPSPKHGHRDHIPRVGPSARQVRCAYAPRAQPSARHAPREYGARTKWQCVNTMRKLMGIRTEHDWWQCMSWMDNARELEMQDKVPDMCARRGLGLSILYRPSYQGSCPHSGVACMGMASDRLVVALWGERRVGREGTQWPGGNAVGGRKLKKQRNQRSSKSITWSSRGHAAFFVVGMKKLNMQVNMHKFVLRNTNILITTQQAGITSGQQWATNSSAGNVSGSGVYTRK